MSARRASSGLSFEARRAGTQHASRTAVVHGKYCRIARAHVVEERIEARAKQRIASALKPRGRSFIDDGDPLREIPLVLQ